MWHHDERTPLWRNVSFTLMWTSTAASGFGDRMMMLAALALLGAMGREVDSTAVNAATQFWFFLPYLLFGLVAGWLADHLPRKWVMLACDESRAVVLLIALLLVPAGMVAPTIPAAEHWKVFAVLFVVGTFAATFYPNRMAIVPQIIPPKQLQAANSIILAIGVIASMIGMVVGDFIIDPNEAGTVRDGLLFAVVLFAVSGTFFAFLKVHHDPRPIDDEPRKKRTFKQGFVYVLHHRKVLILIALHTLVWGSAMIVYAAVLAVGKLNFNLTDKALQTHFVWMGAILGAGMLAGAGFAAALGTRRHAPMPMMFSLVCAGFAVLLTITSSFYWVTMAAAFFIGFAGNIAIIMTVTLIQSITPNYIRGRVMGVDSIVNNLVLVLTQLAIWQSPRLGWDADQIIFPTLYVLGSLLVVLGTVQFLWYLRRGPMPNVPANVLRHIERWFCLVWHRLEWRGRHHIPGDGPVILASNHTTALDPFLLQAACPRMIRWLMLTSYRFPMFNPLWNAIQPICLEHELGNDRAEPGAAQVREIVRELKKGEIVGIFPEGHLQYDDRVLKPFEPGAAVCARLSGAVIVPCWIEGTPRSKKMWVHVFKPTRCRVTFGVPMTVDRKADPVSVTAELRERMLGLAGAGDRQGAKSPRRQESDTALGIGPSQPGPES